MIKKLSHNAISNDIPSCQKKNFSGGFESLVRFRATRSAERISRMTNLVPEPHWGLSFSLILQDDSCHESVKAFFHWAEFFS